jgi:proline dehydrogenase
MRFGAARFVAGQTLDECVEVLRGLNEQGLAANTTVLGEAVEDEAQAEAVTASYEVVIRRLVDEKLNANVSLKLTHLGLELDEELAYANAERLVTLAGGLGSFLRVDMEHSSAVDATLRIYRRIREAGHDGVGTVLQSYLYRTARDLADLLPLVPNLRIVKGAYLEPPERAFPEKSDVDKSFLDLVETGLLGGAYIAVATHDERIIARVREFVAERGIERNRFEFQMLYGVRSALQREVAAAGYKVLVATPYGPDWYPYLMRRLAERPANVAFLLRNLVRP